MRGFITNNSIYKMDLTKKKISGGVFKDQWKAFEKATIIIGLPAQIQLSDGNLIMTSTVREYI